MVFGAASVRAVSCVALLGSAVGAQSAVQFFNSSTPGNNDATRSAWLAAIGISSPDWLEDFESIALNTNVSGVQGLLAGGLVVTDTSTANAAYVRGGSSFFGGSNPVGTRAVAHNEAAWLQLEFGLLGVDYVGGLDIDQAGATIRITYADFSTSTHSLDGTGGSGNSAEFWGFFRNDMPRITKVEFDASGDGGWGLDNLEYQTPVPEPGTLAVLALGIGALVRRRRR